MKTTTNQAADLPNPLEIERHKQLAQYYGQLFNSKLDEVDIHCKRQDAANWVSSIKAYHRDEYAVIRKTFQQLAEYHHAQYLLLSLELEKG